MPITPRAISANRERFIRFVRVSLGESDEQGVYIGFASELLTRHSHANLRDIVKADFEDFPYVGTVAAHTAVMAASLQKRLGQYLRNRRGRMTLPAFARKLGVSSSSLHRMELGEQDVTLKTLEY